MSKFNVKGKGGGGGAKRASIINTLCDDASVVVTAEATGKTKDWVSVCLCGGWEWRRRMEEEERRRRRRTCVIYGCGGGIVAGMRGEVERKSRRNALAHCCLANENS